MSGRSASPRAIPKKIPKLHGDLLQEIFADGGGSALTFDSVQQALHSFLFEKVPGVDEATIRCRDFLPQTITRSIGGANLRGIIERIKKAEETGDPEEVAGPTDALLGAIAAAALQIRQMIEEDEGHELVDAEDALIILKILVKFFAPPREAAEAK